MRENSSNRKRWAAGAILASTAGLVGMTQLHTASAQAAPVLPTTVQTQLHPLNNSGVYGTSSVTINGRQVDVTVTAHRLLENAPHAMHLHFSASADHRCPTVRNDKNADHRLNVSEGMKKYGMIKKSLTTRGDTSPRSGLAVNRFPTARHGSIHYSRSFQVSSKLANQLADGRVVLVIHGIDYNNNGRYDFSAGPSDLDSKIPTEATDPVSCGVYQQAPLLPSGG